MKKGEWAALLLFVVGAAGLGLLPQGRELEELTLLTRLAVDRTGETVTVTALVGARAAEGEEPTFLTGTGPSLAEAVAALEDSPLRHPYLGQTETLLVGEGEELEEVLAFVLDHGEMKTDATLYIVEESAGELLAAWGAEVQGETLPKDPAAVTVGEALAGLTQGRAVAPPVLALDREGRVVYRGGAA